MELSKLARVVAIASVILLAGTSYPGPRDGVVLNPVTPAGDQNMYAQMISNFFNATNGYPRVSFGPGNVEYVEATDTFLIFAPASSIQLVDGGPVIPITNSPIIRASFIVDGSGNLVGSATPPDLLLKGSIDLDQDGNNDVGGVLLTGNVSAFEAMDTGSPNDAYQMSFDELAGPLADLFGDGVATMKVSATNSTFEGSFETNFKGVANGVLIGMPCTGRLGDYVWEDQNNNGIQDPGEPGIDGVELILTDEMGNTTTTTTITGGPTNSAGYYIFEGLCAGTYNVEVNPATVPPGFTPTIINAPGSDPTNDSNDPSGTTVILPTDDSEDLDSDFGYVVPIDIDIEKATNGVDADDPNAGDAPQIAPGDIVTWTYVVTNTGSATLFNVSVVDDQGVVVSCPQDTLAPGESMNCSASGLAEDLNSTGFTTVPGLCGSIPATPLYENMGSVTGESISGQLVQDVDPSHYCNPQNPAIDIEKATNGVDADDPNAGDAPQIAAGDVVTWTYVVTNTGNVTLNDVTVTDDQGVAVSCPQTTLAPGESMNCSASGSADDLNSTGFTTVPGLCGSYPNTPLYENMGHATGVSTTGEFVEDIDPSHYCNPQDPAIDIEKATNGVDADDPNAGDAPQIAAGDVVSWTYVVTNTGNVTIENVVVTDDQGVAVSCPQASLAPGESMICTASGIADDLNSSGFTTVPGLCGGFPNTPMYENMGQVTGTSTTGEFVEDVDPSHYCNPPMPAIDIEKATNGVDADDPNAGDAPQIAAGDVVTWTYVVTNTGNVTLNDVTVTDDQGVAVSCPQTTLAPGESMNCSASGSADDLNSTGFTTVPGLCGSYPNTPLYENMGHATGVSTTGEFVEDIDPSHYCNPQDPAIDIEKATNGVDADDPNAGDAPQIAAGGLVSWTYVVTNIGNVTIENIVVTDDQGVAVSCPLTILAPGEAMTCTASGLADDLNNSGFTTVPGLCGGFPNTPMYENMGQVTGTSTTGEFVQDIDPSHYCNPPMPAIDIEKATNGVDADDPNAGDAPQIAAGDVVTWTYVVTNTGNVTLNDVTVTDDQGVAVSCPQTTLAPGESMNCSASGSADDLNSTGFTTVPGLCGSYPNTPLYENMGRATGVSTTGEFVEDIDPSHYCNPQDPAIDIEKATNGVDADDPNAGDAPQIAIGGLVSWTYVVTNTGNVTINDIVVTDDQGASVSCPLTTLAPGESMDCTASGLADDLNNTGFTTVPGLCGSFPSTPMYENMGRVTGTSTTGEFLEDIDPSHYCNPQDPAIDIEKATNGIDADDPNAGDAPLVVPGGPVSWTYVVTNTGNVTLTNVAVSDDQGVAVSCPQTILAPGQSMICTAMGVADDLGNTTFTTVPGLCGGFPGVPLYENMGRATGEVATGEFVEDVDASHYCNPQIPAIDIEKATNGVDADDPNAGDAPQIPVNGVVNWTYVVTNTGDVTLFNVVVTDDRGVAVSCPLDTLAPGQVMTCAGMGIALDMSDPVNEGIPGLCGNFPNTPLYNNIGSVVGVSAIGEVVQDADPSHYCNPQVPDIDVEKATNGIDADDPNAGDAPQIAAGDTVTWTYLVTNTGDVDLFNVGVVDDQGVIVTCPATTLAAGASMTCTASAVADDLGNTVFTTVPGLCGGVPETPLYQNRGTASGESVAGDFVDDTDPSHYCNPPACSVTVDKSCLIPMPPAGDYVCNKPIDTLTFIWDGAQAVRIKAYKGSVGSELLADIDDIQPGEEVSVMGFAGSPNDVYYEVFAAGTSTKLGESAFHLSCSDPEMDGPEDCGLNEGNGKNNDSGLINDWLLEGIVDAGGTLDCTTDPDTPVNACEFQAFPASCDTGNADFLTFAYTGGGCGASDNDQQDHVCSGSVDGAQSATFTDDDGNSVVLNPGETVTIPRNLAKVMTLSNGGGTETNVAHTSCSQPLVAGDVYGSLTLAQIDGQGIGTQVVYTYTIGNTGPFGLVDLSAVDVPLGPVPGLPGTLAAGQSVTLMTSAFLTETTTNTVVVDATDSQGATCNATAQATVTILPPPPCEINGEGEFDHFHSDHVHWKLTNDGASNATIDSVEISWPAANGDIVEIRFDGDKIFDSNRSGPSTVFGPSDWINDPAKRVIPPGDTDTIEFKFDNNIVGIPEDYSITINFEEGCSVTFVNIGQPFTCNTDIESLTMIWDGGSDPVRVKAYYGSVGSTLLLDQSGISVGDEVTVSGYGGSPNDVFWEVFSGTTLIGESKFHLSCSDNEMNGAEDCGNRQGNGKGNDSGFLNDWIFEGLIDADGPFDCSDLP